MNLKKITQKKIFDSSKFTKNQKEFFDVIMASMDKHKKLLEILKNS